jgi:glycosyltransferase involved in cell wall biosynthesis
VVKQVLVFRPALGDGGADRVTVTLLQHLDRARFAPSLALVRRSGVLAGEVPGDVPVLDLGAPRLAAAVPSLARVIRERRPDVVVCTAGGANTIAVAAHWLARSKARLVLSERSSLRRRDRSGLRAAVELRLKRMAYRRADLVTAVSEGVARDLVELLAVEPSRVHVVYNPMIADDLAARAAEPVTHPWFVMPEPILLAVGRLVEIKDYPTMLAALAEIRRTIPARLAILGDGPLRGELEARARSLSLGDAVAFLGYDKNPYRYMKRARLVIQSSRAEGLPGVLIQSLACGTPVVATDCDHGPREVVRDGGDGYLVRVGDAQALARRALTILGDTALGARLGAAGAEGARRFSIAASMQRYHAAIDPTGEDPRAAGKAVRVPTPRATGEAVGVPTPRDPAPPIGGAA